MRTSLNNIKAIEDYLFGRLATGDALLFEAHLLLNSDLPDDMRHQQNTYTMENGHTLVRLVILAHLAFTRLII